MANDEAQAQTKLTSPAYHRAYAWCGFAFELWDFDWTAGVGADRFTRATSVITLTYREL